MNVKVAIRGIVIGLLLAIPAPILIFGVTYVFKSSLAVTLVSSLSAGDIVGLYVAVTMTTLALLVLASLATAFLSPVSVSRSGADQSMPPVRMPDAGFMADNRGQAFEGADDQEADDDDFIDPDDDREEGEVKWFNTNKGYGFIMRENGDDVFVHFRAVRGSTPRMLTEGQIVRYYVTQNERGLQADDVSIIE